MTSERSAGVLTLTRYSSGRPGCFSPTQRRDLSPRFRLATSDVMAAANVDVMAAANVDVVSAALVGDVFLVFLVAIGSLTSEKNFFCCGLR